MSPLLSESDVAASLCRDSFYEFVQEFWDTIIPDKPHWNWHIKYICDELQKVAERVIADEDKEYDLVINVPPGSTKSTLVSRMFQPWVWTRLASCKFINASFEARLSNSLTRQSRDIVKSEKYQLYYPEIKIRKDLDGTSHYGNTKNGERISASVGGNITGEHANIFVIDDPINPKVAASESSLAAATAWLNETIPSRVKGIEKVPFILIMQRLHQSDPTAVFLETRDKVKHICLPAELLANVKPKKLRKQYKDGLMDPVRLNRRALKIQTKILGPFASACQFDQEPIPRDGAMFDPEKIQIEKTAPPPKSLKGNHLVERIRYWDKAGTTDAGCYSAGPLLGIDKNGHYWILDMVRGQWNYTKRELNMKQTAQVDGVSVRIGIEQEPGSGGKESAERTVSNLAGFRVKTDRPVGDKVLRAEPFSTQVNAGNVSMVEAPWNKDLLDELRYFPNSKYKDQVDALSAAFAMITKNKLKVGAL